MGDDSSAKKEDDTTGEVVEEPVVFEYADYREYLKNYLAFRKSKAPAFTAQAFARTAKLGSYELFRLVLNGKRNLTPERAEKIAEVCFTAIQERRYFLTLVNYTQAKTPSEKLRLEAELGALRPHADWHRLEDESASIVSRWYYLAILELISLRDFKPDAEWISWKLRGRIRPYEAQEALEQLEKHGLLAKGDGSYDTTHQVRESQGMGTPSREALYKYHLKMTSLATDALTRFTSEQREFAGYTFAVPLSALPLLKEEIREFQKRIVQITTSLGESDEVFQLNMNLFPLTNCEKSKK
jgi:uncharacterized protein (TIGR02147 family)